MHRFKSLRNLLVIAGSLLLVAGLSGCGSQAKAKTASTDYQSELLDKGTLTIGLMGDYPPYSYRKDGKLVGFEVEIGQAIAKKAGLKAKFVPTKWDSLVQGLGSQRFDVIINNISITKERKAKYLFASPYIYSKYGIVSRSDDQSLTKLSDVKGKKMIQGTGSDVALLAKKAGGKVSPIGGATWNVMLEQIKEKRFDGTIESEQAWYYYANNHSTKGLTYHLIPTSTQPAAVAAPLLSKKSPKLAKKIKQVMNELKQAGTFTKISKKYFGKDITQE